MPVQALAMERRLRPAALRSKPVRIERVFDEPDEVVRSICEHGPYPTVIEFHKLKDTMGSILRYPWFLTMLQDNLFLHNPSMLAAAREAFSAKFIQPTSCTLNLTCSTERQPPHIDLPVFRGLAAPEYPMWLLMNMSYSKLFHSWMVPVASGLVWFWCGQGGEFEYWPDGLNEASLREKPPLWNVGLMSDNEFMWHRVGPMAVAPEHERLLGNLKPSDKLYYRGGGNWQIRDAERAVASLGPSELRISLLWKAYVFKDEDHLASFKNPAFNLDLDQVIEIYLADLDSRGVKAKRPANPLEEPEWRHLLQDTYAPRFEGQSRYQ